MPLIDCQCALCGVVSEVMRPLSMWPATPECPKCGGQTLQIHLPRRPSFAAPVVVYKMPDGSFRFPGTPTSPMTKQYEDQGGTRIELRGWAEVRPFEKHMNEVERGKIERRMERQHRAAEAGQKERRSELYRRMASMSDGAKRFGRALVRYNDAKPSPKPYEPGFRIEAYSENRSNRDEARDARGRRTHD